MSKFNPFDPANGYSEEDRVALETKCASLINRAYRNPFPGASLRHDGADNAGIFFAKQLAHIKTKAYDKEFPELSGLKLFPQTSDTDEGASYIEYYSYEPVGFAAIIANYASDLPRVDVKGTPHRAEIVNIGDSYGYNVQELRACRRNAVLGIMKSLDAVRAEAARRVYDVKVNHLIWNGDEKAKIVGILSSDNNIPVYTLQNGAGGKADWASKTADEIAADIAGILNYIDTLTQSVEHPDSWVMPNDLYTALNLRRIDGTGESVLSYIKEHTPRLRTGRPLVSCPRATRTTTPLERTSVCCTPRTPIRCTMMCLWHSSSMRRRTATSKSSSTVRAATPEWSFLIRCPPASSTVCKKGACL